MRFAWACMKNSIFSKSRVRVEEKVKSQNFLNSKGSRKAMILKIYCASDSPRGCTGK